mgnify:CR=1 FL=1
MNLIYVLVHFYLYKIYEWIRINNWKIVTICYSFDEGHSVFWLRMKEIAQYRFCPKTTSTKIMQLISQTITSVNTKFLMWNRSSWSTGITAALIRFGPETTPVTQA